MVMIVKTISMFYMGVADRDRLMEVTRRQIYILKNGALKAGCEGEQL